MRRHTSRYRWRVTVLTRCCLAYTRTNGESRHHFEHNDHYAALKSWLFDEGLSHTIVGMTLGTDESFFAATSQGHRWRGLPEGASDYYQKFTRADLFLTKRVNQIDLGYNGAYLGTSSAATPL